MKTYEVIIPERFWGKELSRFFIARSAGSAKYQYWLKYCDCYDLSFGDFVKAVKCRKVK